MCSGKENVFVAQKAEAFSEKNSLLSELSLADSENNFKKSTFLTEKTCFFDVKNLLFSEINSESAKTKRRNAASK